MSPVTRSLLPRYLSLLAIVAALLLVLWYSLGRPHLLPDARLHDGRLQCASYSPFDADQSPFDKPQDIRRERVAADVAMLAQRFSCLRTYAVKDMEFLPQLAREHGITLMIGAWVSGEPKDTRKEIALLIETANANPDVVKSVIVGNEALLRRDVKPDELIRLLREVQAQVSQPVTYAEVWEFWEKYPQIIPEVDFITVHLLPYWEDDPSGIDTALAQVERVHDRFVHEYGKPVFIGETGWPSEGRQREDALPSRLNEARFMRGFIEMAEEHGWNYNLIEAFDQPWKRISEGTVGGFWGLWDAQRVDKNILAGPVSNLPDWPRWLGVSLLLLVAALAMAGLPASGTAALLLPLTAGVASAAIGLWLQQLLLDSRHAGEWLWNGGLLVLNLAVATHALLQANPAAGGWRRALAARLQARMRWLVPAIGIAAALMMTALVCDPRYRSFPSSAFILPALCWLLLPVRGARVETTLAALILAIGIPLSLWQETLLNGQAVLWAITSALLALALWLRRAPAA